MRGGPGDHVLATDSRIGQRLAESDAVGEAMGDDEADPRAAVGERENGEVPFGSVLGIQGGVGLVVQLRVEFFTGTGTLDDLDVG